MCVRTGSPSPFHAPTDGGRDWGLGVPRPWAERVCGRNLGCALARLGGGAAPRSGEGLGSVGPVGRGGLAAADELSVSGPLTWSWDYSSFPPTRAPRSALFLLFLFLLQPTHTQFRQRCREVVRVPWLGDCVWFLFWRPSLVLRHYEPEL